MDWSAVERELLREEIKKLCAIGREKASKPGFAQTPRTEYQLARMREVRELRGRQADCARTEEKQTC